MDDMPEDKRRSKGEATRMALLEAALVLFGERGFEGTSTRDIAGLAELKAQMAAKEEEEK